MYLLDEQRRRREIELAIVETQLAILIASDRKQLSLLREDQSVGATARDLLDQDIEAQALRNVHMPVSVVLRRVLAVTQLAIVIASLREILCIPVGDLLCTLFCLGLQSIRGSVITIFARSSTKLISCLGWMGVAAKVVFRDDLEGGGRPGRVSGVLELPPGDRAGAVAISSERRLAHARRVAGTSLLPWLEAEVTSP